MAASASVNAQSIVSMHTPGSIVNQYRIEQRLGEGATGVVYRAWDLRLRRPVALRFLRRELQADDAAWRRRLNLARVVLRLSHPALCAIYEVAQDQGQIYIAMEYVTGQSLKQLLVREGMAKETVLLYGTQLVAALEHAHERGIIHGDIRSSNVMVKAGGAVKLLEPALTFTMLGQAQTRKHASSEQLRETRRGNGTLSYLAPELLEGGRASVQSDIWALGVLIYEMAAGKLPFTGRSRMEVSLAIFARLFPPLPRDAGSRLAAIIQRCLQKERAQRYSGVREIRGDIQKILLTSREGRPIFLHNAA
jgi:serine/threonine-protein kinase